MTKSQLIEAVSERIDMPKAQAERLVNAIFDEMRMALCNGSRIEFRGFGSFQVREYKSMVARNPRTGEPVQVPPRRRVRFRMSDLIFKRLNENFLS